MPRLTQKRTIDPKFKRAPDEASRSLARVRAALVPGLAAEATPEEMSRRLAADLAILPPDRRRDLRRQMTIAVVDLEELVGTLQARLNDLAKEMQKVGSYSSAVGAYNKVTRRQFTKQQ